MYLNIPGYSKYKLNTENNRIYNDRGHEMAEHISGDPEKEHRCIVVDLKNDNGEYKHVRKHRVVYTAHNPDEDISNLQINHLDEDPFNNDISNLQACTAKENVNYGTGNLRRSATMKNRPNTSVTVAVKATVIETGEVEYYESMTEAAKHFNVCLSSIRSAVVDENRTSVGRIWEHYYGG